MATIRRKPRQAAGGFPEKLRYVFMIGCGMNHMDEAWLIEQWHEHGEAFLAWYGTQESSGPCFFEVLYGTPGRQFEGAD